MTTDNDFIVAIELGSSKISGIAGKKKDGTMHVLAYAEEKSAGCIRRGMAFNIEKTYQCINSIIGKLETVLKAKITRVYVGLGGQSVRSFRCVIKRNMLTQSYITNEAIDNIRQESYEIPFADCEVLENFPQEYVVDSNVIADPVGVMGTNIEGEFLDVIGKSKLRANIATVFANTNVEIAEELISPLQLADNILTDAEKRSGCVLVDLGAETTTVIVYKNNIVRYLVTIPLGSNNVNKDLASIQIEDAEAEDIKLKYGDACTQDVEGAEDMEPQTYTTTDGRQIEVALLRNIIEARVGEIVANVSSQIVNSNYSGKLLAGIVLTGGGSNMKNIVNAFVASTKIDKVRIAKKINQTVIKTSNAPSLSLDNSQTNTIVSLLLAGTVPCGGGAFDGADIFGQQQKDEERRKRQEEAEAAAAQEAQDAIAFDNIKASIRSAYEKVIKQTEELAKASGDKSVRKKANDLANSILDEVLGERFDNAAAALEGKDKYKQSLKEGAELAEKLTDAVDNLSTKVKKANKDNSFWGRIKRGVSEIVNEDNN